ncbi:hypothetical protein M2222_001647 [Bradyrhizobium elkanii]|uniref:hypothetical protein n=1 Tax=Bradyrhizobium elkanii TaxID=29448 RepID=UPI002169DA03|nr:hypothetical protein [Bradyrhizobium elkanii]MCS3449532.1 hypothetical protein [Bradyrhizobium elkanii]MCS3559325.1 hypothetical protein [Bradyrhizobium elkanii]MCW2150829.1 hypothetical protein [Bradyrhizobium elkanii]MCW2374560.1 hypothetical protein [Bradyrhizobium elkanii]
MGVNSLVHLSTGIVPESELTMSTNPYINFSGASGAVYSYWRVDQPRNGATLQDVGGNYAFLKKLPNGNYVPVYFGQADSLRNRLPSHERLDDAIKAGASVVVAHTTPAGEAARLSEERDLIAKWNPVLNTHHRTTG